MVGVGAEDVVGLARGVQELAHGLAAQLGQGPGLVLQEPLVRLEARGAQELLALEAPEVRRLLAAGARGLRAHNLPVHGQAPLQALEEDVIQDRALGVGGKGRLADRALQVRGLQAARAQRVQAKQQLRALGFCLAALAAQELELLLLRGLLGARGEG